MVLNSNVLTKYGIDFKEIFSDDWRIDNWEWWKKLGKLYVEVIIPEYEKIMNWKQGFIIAGIVAPIKALISFILIFLSFFKKRKDKKISSAEII